ncbi:TonB-dependent receptor domain-containing protein [Dyella caseinilytica]|uniref:TonB-dependent receptor n=1 Tax=Dyella caseinilytica TaxID=1849581 RepID=A0ABX7GUH6_9GAMM|nr:TonB-dependent receptor [Dyella caseinilytica]QRN53954.1 TonB-dependent receptor [Dyella caseinilytica]GFZ90420.1 TonB-dependent receptor [Dyella caseinilytica]
MKQKTMLAAAIATALMLHSWAVSAQDTTPTSQSDQADAKKAKDLDTVTVTGSHIRSVDVETSQPVYTMTRQQIQATGLTNLNDVLARLPSAGTPDITPQDTLSSGMDVGGRYVDIRYLGSNRTLVLVNGHRWSSSLSGLTDLSTIPVSMIERIDVLKDGASSVYGSDAIAGVVNIITREKFEGAEANVYYGSNQKGDGQQKNADFTWGHSTAKSSTIIGASYQDESAIWDRSRDITRYAYGPRHPDDGLGMGPWGRVTDPATGDQYVINHGNAGTGNINSYHLYEGDPSDLYNSSQDMTFRAGSKLKTVFAQERYKLTDDITLSGTATYSTRDTSSQLAGYPLSTAAINTANVVIDPNNAYNPFPGDETTFSRRTVELPRITWANSRLAHLDVGAQGYFNFLNHDWSWDANYTFSQTKIRQITTGNLYLPNLLNAIGPTTMIDGQLACANAAARAAGCTPWNVLAGPGFTSSSQLNYLNSVGVARQQSQTDDITINTGGGLFDLPAGTVNVAGGLEHRREKGYFNPYGPDSAGLTTNLASDPSSGRYDVNEAYLELDVPVLRDLPGAQELGINVASRYSHYSNFGSTTNNKYSVRWRPITDLLVRGTYAKGFRAPALQDLYGGDAQSFETFLDPCDSAYGAAASNPSIAASCAAGHVPANYRQVSQSGPVGPGGGQTTIPFTLGSNPNLKPETSSTRTMGLVYSPHYVDGLDMSVDYYDIRLKQAITYLGASDVLNYCYVDNLPNYCSNITRDSSGLITSLREGPVNLGAINTSGFDFGIHYRLPSTPFGQFRVGLDGNYLSTYQTSNGPGSLTKNLAGWMNGTQALYRVHTNVQLDWDYKQFGASWTVRYYSGLKDSCWDVGVECNNPDYPNPVDPGQGMAQKGSATFNDAQFRYKTPWDGTLSVGVNNIFNKKGPYYYNVSFAGSGSPPYNPQFDIDRYFYVQYSQKF